MKLEKPEHVGLLIAETINQVRVGKIDVKVANTIGFLAGIWLKALELTQVADRIEGLEARNEFS
ncbi:MAG: hypothetical protein ACLQU2_29575 [Candidatus Binataceae bacterium]